MIDITPYAVGGSISGLVGSVVLQDNGSDNHTVSANGSFVFATKVVNGGPYNVTVLAQPPGQACSVSSGSGTISGNVNNVTVTCANNFYTVGGSVAGLIGSVVLQNNGGNSLTISANGNFAFATPVANGSTYSVTVLTQPIGQTCSVSTGAGTGSGGNVTNVTVVCSTNTYSVGGAVSGLVGSVVLQDNNSDNLIVAANGGFTFAAQVASGSSYSVTVLNQPTGQICSVTSGIGTIALTNISNIVVTCTNTNTYTIGGTVTGLSGSMVLQNNGGDNLTINANGTFTFATPIVNGSAYNVTIFTLPALQPCTQTYGASTVSGRNVTNVNVICGPTFAGGFSATGAMTAARSYHSATLLQDGRVLVIGGGTAELYDPALGTWSATTGLLTLRGSGSAMRLPNGKVLVEGGRDINNQALATAELFDPASGTWSATGSMTTARYLHSATLLLDGKVMVAGGFGAAYLASAEIYDPATGAWTTVGNMTTARYPPTAQLLPNGKVLVAGGAYNASAELFDPATGTWTATGSLASVRGTLTLTLLPNGKVLVAGGADTGGSALAVSEIYDPATEIWSATGNMNSPRFAHTATLLSNGKVLVAGGSTWAGVTIYSSSELYDPNLGTWTSAGIMSTARRNHAAILLLNGKLLVSGGLTPYITNTSSADLFW